MVEAFGVFFCILRFVWILSEVCYLEFSKVTFEKEKLVNYPEFIKLLT